MLVLKYILVHEKWYFCNENKDPYIRLIMSPQYIGLTLCFVMFCTLPILLPLAPPPPPAADIGSHDNFWTTFQISFILAGLMALTYRLPDKILFAFHLDFDLELSRSSMEFVISYKAKMVQLPQNKKQTCQLKSSPKMSPSDLTMAMTLTLNFQGQILNLLYVSQKWPDCHETKNKHIYWPQGLKWNIMFHLDHNLELEFSRSSMEIAISYPKWSSCHKMKNKHIDRTEGLKFYHCVWHWTCPWKVRWPGWLKMPACHWFI